MHPGMMAFWKARRGGCGGHGEARFACGDAGPFESAREVWEAMGHGGGEFGGGAFGVRRPLRFLAHKLDLDDAQVAELARILDTLKIERAQAAVEDRRVLSGFADAVTGDGFDKTKAAEIGSLRVKAEERLRDAVVTALEKLHATLRPEQRAQLAMLIRTGILSL